MPAQYSDEDDDDRSVAFEPLVKQLRKRKASTKRTERRPHMRAVASRIADALVEDHDGDYEEGHAGKRARATSRGHCMTTSRVRAARGARRDLGPGLARLRRGRRPRAVVAGPRVTERRVRRRLRFGAGLAESAEGGQRSGRRGAGRQPAATAMRSWLARRRGDCSTRPRARGQGLGLGLRGAAAAAFARSLRDLFAGMDADGDGVLTKREVRDALADLGERDNRPGMRPHQIQKQRRDRPGRRRRVRDTAELAVTAVEQTEEGGQGAGRVRLRLPTAVGVIGARGGPWCK